MKKNKSSLNKIECQGNLMWNAAILTCLCGWIFLVYLYIIGEREIFDFSQTKVLIGIGGIQIIVPIIIFIFAIKLPKKIEVTPENLFFQNVYGFSFSYSANEMSKIVYRRWNQAGFQIHFKDGRRKHLDIAGVYKLDKTWTIPNVSKELDNIPFAKKANIIGYNAGQILGIPFVSDYISNEEVPDEI